MPWSLTIDATHVFYAGQALAGLLLLLMWLNLRSYRAQARRFRRIYEVGQALSQCSPPSSDP